MKVVIRPQSEFNPEAPEVGFYDLPEAVYRAAPGHNWSTIKEMEKNPFAYQYARDYGREDTPDLRKGRLYHTLLFEPSLLNERYIAFPETYPKKGTKKNDPPKDTKWTLGAHFCRDWKVDMEAKGFEPVKKSDIVTGQKMMGRLRALPDALAAIEGAAFEVSGFWMHPEFNVLCKMKLDALNNGTIIDYKKVGKTPSGRVSHFVTWCNIVRGLRYHGQCAFYRDGTDEIYKQCGLALPASRMFKWLIVEDAKPYHTAIYTIIDEQPDGSMQGRDPEGNWRLFHWGRELYKWLLADIIMWEDHDGDWPSYNFGPSLMTEDCQLELPKFFDLSLLAEKKDG